MTHFPALAESQFETCPHCEGSGRVRTSDAAAIMLLRGLEEEAAVRHTLGWRTVISGWRRLERGIVGQYPR